ncbi:RecBCD enzyme subunit RecD [Methanimicrococcus hongohii]|uniref:RecBCD enzyme subunit RecD n=1 Tax=Methanimicrococcus hongohii TaxID=3028295 RepID=A0AA96V0Q1_9EURY|nr:AAA domain-containing protein [Methanimicrococcus sp. Hf6]WNY22848.1 RecBCD enzyme subunit RecD [Methanimicrococcus sp. Hf6]
MDKFNENYFSALYIDRSESANTLEKPSMRGVKKSVVDKYSDQAHFIYELIQNADDTKATKAHFELRKEGLVFTHNGTKRFLISNPATEDEDTQNGCLGDINAITAIANSNKTTDSSIGKFGVGFKAVFQYTQTPHIYDPEIFFKIERFIVPVRLDNDFEGRNENETLFYFPFNFAEKGKEEAYIDISEKLHSLTYPILFLQNLKEITYEIASSKGSYHKTVNKTAEFENATAQFLRFSQQCDEINNEDNLWLISRTNENNYTYSVGFFLNEKGNLMPVSKPAFCYFPTKEITGLNFVIHAPFLLTDSREGIKAAESHNKKMIKELAELAADSLLILKKIGQEQDHTLINDDIFDIIPYDESLFNDVDDKSRISFKPFYTKILEKISSEELLPSSCGYVKTENACWAAVPKITEIFSNEQLAMLMGNPNAKWVFTSFGRDEKSRNNKALAEYIDSLIIVWLNEEDIITGWSYDDGTSIKGITADFIEAQSDEWLHAFYKWISETNTRTYLIKEKPIFLNQEGEAVSAFDKNEQLILFLPSDMSENYMTINTKLIENENTFNFIKKLGITEPSLRDEIYNIILPLYENNKGIDTSSHFKKFYRYYKECKTEEMDEYIGLIWDCKFIRFSSEDKDTVYRGKASDLYIPTDELKVWFKPKPKTRFIKYDEYLEQVGKDEKKSLDSFFEILGAKTEPSIEMNKLSWDEAHRRGYNWTSSTRTNEWKEYHIDGCQEVLNYIQDNKDQNFSYILWNQLLSIISSNYYHKLDRILRGRHEYFYRTDQEEFFDSSEIIRLRTYAWLLNRDGEFVSAEDLTVQSLSQEYDIQHIRASDLLEFLNIREEIIENDEIEDYLTEEQRAKIEFADTYSDVPPEVLQKAAKEYRERKRIDSTDEIDLEQNGEIENNELAPEIKRVVKDITKRITHPKLFEPENQTSDNTDVIDSDEDEFIKPVVDYSKKIEQAKQKSAKEIEEIERLEDLTNKAQSAERYTFGWFKALLELELQNSPGNNSQSREVSISFAQVEHEKGTERTLILKHPNRYIPQSMEDLADIPLTLHYGDKQKQVAIEVVNVKSYTLRVKLRTNADISDIDLSTVTQARIEAKNPVFLLDELRRQFNALPYEDDFNMHDNLCENIDFIFGPPGTGKTTYIAKDVLMPIMEKTENLKVLVLTPTNKAADVLVNRIMEWMGDDKDYLNWLVRFGTTDDTNIEDIGVYRDKTFDIRTFPRNVTVTTMARFPYDYFLPDDGSRLHLSALKWDYIVIDEASMIPLVNIIYPLYKKTPTKFIIAGDPFQIEPITSVDLWKNENIYTMVNLNSFVQPETTPHKYKVELLTTQYRSVPNIGEVFSRFAYGGVLQHHRVSENQKKITIKDFIDLKPLNIIKFPVSKYESIYRPKRLNSKSNYQMYSALFTFEFAKHLSSNIELLSKDEKLRIGIIAPYRAQADLIDRFIASSNLPKNVDIQVGTIHGFQGDECDIIIAVFNPPPKISSHPDMFLNKLNIINVSISRARDYLFILMPDDQTEEVQNLRLIKKVEKLCKETEDYTEIHSESIEKIIFDNENYLLDNTFSTSHQSVNVYGKPEKIYEIRSEDDAIDVQIHKNT